MISEDPSGEGHLSLQSLKRQTPTDTGKHFKVRGVNIDIATSSGGVLYPRIVFWVSNFKLRPPRILGAHVPHRPVMFVRR